MSNGFPRPSAKRAGVLPVSPERQERLKSDATPFKHGFCIYDIGFDTSGEYGGRWRSTPFLATFLAQAEGRAKAAAPSAGQWTNSRLGPCVLHHKYCQIKELRFDWTTGAQPRALVPCGSKSLSGRVPIMREKSGRWGIASSRCASISSRL